MPLFFKLSIAFAGLIWYNVLKKGGESVIRIAVCDDIREAVTQINGYLIEYQNLKNQKFNIRNFYNAEELWEHLKTNNCDLIILDIELVQMNGVELGRLIRTELNDHDIKIIYISALDTYDRQLFDMQPLNFLSKPIDKEKLYETLDLAVRLSDDKNHIFAFKDKNGSHRLRAKDILYFESLKHDFKVVTINEVFNFRSSLSEIMNQLPSFGFAQVHRSYIINYDQIKTIKYEEIIMSNGDAIPISRNKRKEIREVLMQFGGERL